MGNEITTEQWSEVLVQALPYFKNWCGKVAGQKGFDDMKHFSRRTILDCHV